MEASSCLQQVRVVVVVQMRRARTEVLAVKHRQQRRSWNCKRVCACVLQPRDRVGMERELRRLLAECLHPWSHCCCNAVDINRGFQVQCCALGHARWPCAKRAHALRA